MKRLIIVALALSVIATLGVAVASHSSAAPKEKSPFVGEWETIDIFDGSWMEMKITGHHNPHHMKLVDDWASACPEGGPATAQGKVTYSDPMFMDVEYTVRCHVGHYKFEGAVSFGYGPGLLIDSWGNLWFPAP